VTAHPILEVWMNKVRQLRETQNSHSRGSDDWLLFKIEADRLEQCVAELGTYLDVYEPVRQ
jgi:hypothetical protein